MFSRYRLLALLAFALFSVFVSAGPVAASAPGPRLDVVAGPIMADLVPLSVSAQVTVPDTLMDLPDYDVAEVTKPGNQLVMWAFAIIFTMFAIRVAPNVVRAVRQGIFAGAPGRRG